MYTKVTNRSEAAVPRVLIKLWVIHRLCLCAARAKVVRVKLLYSCPTVGHCSFIPLCDAARQIPIRVFTRYHWARSLQYADCPCMLTKVAYSERSGGNASGAADSVDSGSRIHSIQEHYPLIEATVTSFFPDIGTRDLYNTWGAML